MIASDPHRAFLRSVLVAVRPILLVVMTSAVLPLVAPRMATGQGVQLASDAPRALSPEESRQLFRLPVGFHIELVAGEPHLADPVAMAFDARGRILVCEIHGYNLEGYLDVLELNKTGELDTQVRRIAANDDAVKQAEGEQYGTVKLLEDSDGDGRIDRSTVLADRLPPCYGVLPARGGVIVFCAPDIIFLADRDGDGKAEVRETLFTGFGVGELWTRINNPRWRVDNWIYGVSGANSGGTIRGPHLAEDVALGSVCFRFQSGGRVLEAASGRTSGYGQAMNDWGDRFLCTNQQHAMHVIPIGHRYLARNPYYAAPSLTRNISGYGHPARVYPTSKPDPWRRARAADPAWVRFYGQAEATANGYFTAASGQTIYQGTQFPAEFRGNHFSVDNAQNMIHRCLLTSDGVSYVARRPDADQHTEFLTSTEQWFRPVNLTTGPDGALYVVDMYRDIIEDYSAIPRHLQQRYIRSLIAGADKGRIWRIVADDAPPSEPLDLAKATTDQLVPYLSHSNYWQRMTAQRLIIQRQDATVVAALQNLIRTGPTPQARLHALYAVSGLDALTPDLLKSALQDSHFAVRVHALRVAEGRFDRHLELLPVVLSMVDDPHPRVRLQLALSLGESDSLEAGDALVRLALKHGEDPWLAAGVLSSAAESADRVLAAIVREGTPANHARGLLHPLASIVGARRDDRQVSEVLSTLAELPAGVATRSQIVCLGGLLEGLQRGRATGIGTPKAAAGLRRLLASDDSDVRGLAIRAAGLIRLQQVPEMKAIFDDARRVALDDNQAPIQRTRAVGLLAAAPLAEFKSTAAQLLDPRQPIEVQLATVEALGTVDHAEAASLLLERFAGYTPRIRSAVIEAMFARQDRLSILLDAVERTVVPRASLDATRREQLIRNPKPEIATRAKKLFSTGTGTPDRRQVLARYAAALGLPRDVQRGKKVFDSQCAKCHKLGDEGYTVGPDLLTAKTRADETLLSDMLDPGNQITVGYDQYTVLTVEGRIFTGVLAAETATSITLLAEENKETTILRKDIDEMSASTLSMMPQDLEKVVTPQDLADLLGFLRESLGSPNGPLAVLFDDEAGFLDVLTEGEGRLRLERADPYAGSLSLAVTPPQRFSARIAGWQYRITENPGPGEFRYLRFAWKQRTGDGVMIELAADGQWPSADQSRRRYFSGKNTTAWSAVQIAQERPEKWILVTRDLWKDFGPFTLTGIAPTAMGGEAMFDRIELLRRPDDASGR
ncbi:MAG: HEAT repeat domain-containing protein [Planctomycetes bacterium]|nr:HEAT repeat domain-containing protein [Planctomycetota bacterium]